MFDFSVPVGRRAIDGIIWTFAQGLAARVCALLSQLVLAALLSPTDFGEIGLAYSVIAVASSLVNLRLDDIILQRNHAVRFWAGPALWMSVILATLAALGTIIISPFAAALLRTPDLVGLLTWLALSIPIGASSIVPGIMLRARMDFRFLAAYGSCEIVALALFTIMLAKCGFGPYSFAIPVPFLGAIKALVWWRRASLTKGLRADFRRWKFLLSRIANVFIAGLLMSLISQGDYLVLGYFGSKEDVGRYYFGFKLAAQPLWMLANSVGAVFLPVLVRFRSDPAKQAEITIRASKVLNYVVMPLALLQAALAKPILTAFFGQKWSGSIVIIEILSVGLAFDAASWIAGASLRSRGMYSHWLKSFIVQAPLFFIFVVIGALSYKATGVAAAVFLYYFSTQPIFVFTALKGLGITVYEIVLIYLRPLLISAVASGAGWSCGESSAFNGHPLFQALAISIVTAAIYLGLVYWRATDIWREFWRFGGSMWADRLSHATEPR